MSLMFEKRNGVLKGLLDYEGRSALGYPPSRPGGNNIPPTPKFYCIFFMEVACSQEKSYFVARTNEHIFRFSSPTLPI